MAPSAVVGVALVMLLPPLVQCVTEQHNVTVAASSHDLKVAINSSTQIIFRVEGVRDGAFELQFVSSPTGVLDPVKNEVVAAEQTEVNVTVHGVAAGSTTLQANGTNSTDVRTDDAFVRIVVFHSAALNTLCDVVGWIYFIAWSVSFYPQIVENWRRKSVLGLNFDFLSLNIVGFLMYSIFNISLLYVRPIEREYLSRHPTGVNPVQLNDVFFAVHALFACAITILQCFLYERGEQRVSRTCRGLLVAIFVLLAVCIVLSSLAVLAWLDFVYICSYIKLGITLVKYVPQAYMNYRRKSTMGWSIGNVLLDFTGGTLSIGQMFVLSYNHDDWSSIFGDPTKFGLGLFSVVFDIIFIAQHYCLYRNNASINELINDDVAPPEDSDSSTGELIPQSSH